MSASPASDLDPYIERLRRLPFVKAVDVQIRQSPTAHEDLRLSVRTPKGRHEILVEFKHTPLNRTAAQSLVARASRSPKQSWAAFSPYVSPPIGQLLASHGIGFLDQAGNCYIALGQNYLSHVEGRRPQLPRRLGRGLGAKSYQVLFALLARPDLAAAPIRSLAESAGVRKTTAAELMQRLEEDKLLLRAKPGRRIARPADLLDRWLAGYADKLRPRLLVGRYRSAERQPAALEKHVENAIGDRVDWAWGGAAAGFRLTQHYRGETTTLHVASAATSLSQQLGFLTAKDGPIVVLGVPGPLSLAGPVPHVVHPLLAYTELLIEGGDRSREAADEIRARYLTHLV